jgi:hypothetical protein
MSIGIPYAMRSINKKKQVVATCPVCKKRIVLHTPKDAESMSGVEYAKHWEEKHAKSEDPKC